MGTVYTFLNQLEKAEIEANQVVKLKPKSSSSYRFRANLETVMEKTNESERRPRVSKFIGVKQLQSGNDDGMDNSEKHRW